VKKSPCLSGGDPENKKPAYPDKYLGEEQKKEFAKHPWLLGLLGSDVMLLLLFLTLYKARRLVPAEDYREMRSLWLGLILPATLMSIVVFIFGTNHHIQWVCKTISLFSSCWLFFLMMKLREDGYVRHKILQGKARNWVSSVLVGSILFVTSIYLVMPRFFETGYELVTTMLASILGFCLSGHLFKLAYIAKNRELK